MTALYLSAAVVLLSTIAVGLLQAFRPASQADSLLAALLFATTGVALVLLLGKALGFGRAVDVALLFALLGAVLGVAFVLRGWPEDRSGESVERRMK